MACAKHYRTIFQCPYGHRHDMHNGGFCVPCRDVESADVPVVGRRARSGTAWTEPYGYTTPQFSDYCREHGIQDFRDLTHR